MPGKTHEELEEDLAMLSLAIDGAVALEKKDKNAGGLKLAILKKKVDVFLHGEGKPISASDAAKAVLKQLKDAHA